MALTPEGRVKKAVREWLKAHGIWHFMPVSNGMGRMGVSDIIGCYQGRFLAIETKAPGKIKNVTPGQAQFICEVRAAGGVAIVIDDVSQLDKEFGGHENV